MLSLKILFELIRRGSNKDHLSHPEADRVQVISARLITNDSNAQMARMKSGVLQLGMNPTQTSDALRSSDVEAVLKLAQATGLYTPAQLALIEERCTAFVRDRRVDDYEVIVRREHETAQGFLIFRKRSLTDAAFEIGQVGGRDLGQIAHLLEALREEVLKREGKLIFAELPDQPGWQPILDTLQNAGYRLAGQTPHVYAPGSGTKHYVLHLNHVRQSQWPATRPPPPAINASHLTAATLSVVPTTSAHGFAIRDMTASTSVFLEEDRAIVEELLDLYLDKGIAEGYFFLSCLSGEDVAAYACYGPRPSTAGTYDLYWICTDARRQQGAGRSLMNAIEAQVLERGGYLVLLETSDTPAFAPTRKFYEALGYTRVVHIEQFYSEADGLAVYAKYLRSGLSP